MRAREPQTLQGCNRMSLACVPVYDTLGDNAVEYIIQHANAQVGAQARVKG